MSITIDESGIRFEFDARWQAIRWDGDGGPFRAGIEKLKGEIEDRDLNHGRAVSRTESTRAVDIVGVVDGVQLVLLEVKSFRPQQGAVAGSGPRALAFGNRWQDIPLEVALETRDTLAGLTGVVLRQQPSDVAAMTKPALLESLRVLAAIALVPRPREPHSKRNTRLGELEANLKRRLAWATKDVLVLDPIEQRDEFERLGIRATTVPWTDS